MTDSQNPSENPQSTPKGEGLVTAKGGANPPTSLYNKIMQEVEKPTYNVHSAQSKEIIKEFWKETQIFAEIRNTMKLLIRDRNKTWDNAVKDWHVIDEEGFHKAGRIGRFLDHLEYFLQQYFPKSRLSVIKVGNLKRNTRYFKKGQKVYLVQMQGSERYGVKGYNRRTKRNELHWMNWDSDFIMNERLELVYQNFEDLIGYTRRMKKYKD